MALCVCKCLNILLKCDKTDDNVDIGKLDLTATEQRDIFFSENLMSWPQNALRIQVAQPALYKQRSVGRWTLHTCLACGQTTHAHAVLQGKTDVVLVNKATQTALDRISNLKKSGSFSPVFNLLVPEVTHDVEMKENIDSNNLMMNETKGLPLAQQPISSLSKQLNQSLQSQLEAVEEAVRQFRDQKYAEFEAYRERAQRDHKILSSIVNKVRSNHNDGWKVDTTLDNGPPSPQLPPPQRRRLSSIKDTKKISQINAEPDRNLPPEEHILDTEDIFDLEGTDTYNNMISDQDDNDSDQDNDEDINISRPRGGANKGTPDIARSLPINMPKFPNERNVPSDYESDGEPQNIAESIKALARSVHGDVFELPRPRFSTQI